MGPAAFGRMPFKGPRCPHQICNRTVAAKAACELQRELSKLKILGSLATVFGQRSGRGSGFMKRYSPPTTELKRRGRARVCSYMVMSTWLC